VKRRTLLASAGATGTLLATGTAGLAQDDAEPASPSSEGESMTDTVTSGYAPVNGLQMYYEIHGEGEPLVLLHGAYGAIDMWGPILSTLAESHQVIAVELQGHGHTADIDRPIRYETMADDVAALMEHLGVAQADIVGYSMGSGVALQLALRHAELVRKLVPISVSYSTEGVYPEIRAGIEEITPEVFAGSPVEEAYFRSAPNPDDWPLLIEKLVDLGTQVFSWPEDEIAAISAPTLLIIGDSDIVKLEHAVALFKLLGGGVPGDLTGLPNSQLAFIPGATHVGLADSAAYWLPMVTTFLAAPMPEAA
jgi:pimeloyl-ACP methyl ester carboxylesterase